MKKFLIFTTTALVAGSLLAGEILNKGVDFTGITSLTPTKLNNIVDNAMPASHIGFVVVTNGLPSFALGPSTNFVWLDSTTSPYTLKTWDPSTSGWVAGTVAPLSITSGLLGPNAVISGKVAANAIWTTNINDNAITSDKIQAASVTTAKIAVDAIDATLIADDAVVTDGILDAAVTTAKIAAGNITAALMAASSVSSTNILDNSIVTADLQENIIVNTNLATDAVHSTNILDGTIVLADIAANAVAGKFVSALQAFPVGGADTGAIAHSLDGIPQSVRVVLVCNTGDLGYVSPEEVNIESLDDANGHCGVYWIVDGTNITLYRSNVASASLYLPTKTTGAPAIFTAASWDLKVYAIYIP
tara:strand:- start:23 stop:1102 length:1080 start_codon:yes stop_codon:yes gene_type:complete